jgi:hypothetical protein
MKADTIVYSTTLLLKAVVVCDSLDNVGIPALLTYDVTDNDPESIFRLWEDFKILVPAAFYEQAVVLLDTAPVWTGSTAAS